MAPYYIAICIAPPELANITGRYLYLSQSQDGASGSFYCDNSLVELAKQVDPEYKLDWSTIERDLLEKGIFKI